MKQKFKARQFELEGLIRALKMKKSVFQVIVYFLLEDNVNKNLYKTDIMSDLAIFALE